MTYKEFIQNIINTRGQWGIDEQEIFEAHHIIPRCLGGLPKNSPKRKKHENIIWLYPEEHFMAHKLLAEENPDIPPLKLAFARMSKRDNLNISQEFYSESRRAQIEYNKDCTWYNDGKNEYFIHKDCKTRDGLKMGRLPRDYSSTDGCISITNGQYNIFIKPGDVIPEGFKLGQTRKNDFEVLSKAQKKSWEIKSDNRVKMLNQLHENNKNKHWYTNGVENIWGFECPDGYWLGRSFKSSGSTGYHWYNNGVKNIQAPSCPEGYFVGKLKRR